jgi:hypothetical protein
VDDAGLGREACEGRGGGGRREIEDPVRRSEDRQRIVRHRDAQRRQARQGAGVLAQDRRALPLDGAREAAAVDLGDRLDEHAPHAPGRADHHEPHLRHRLSPLNTRPV